jgi:hypothetical protein
MWTVHEALQIREIVLLAYLQAVSKTSLSLNSDRTVDPRFNSHAFTLLTRDIENVCQYVARYGLSYDGKRIAHQLWYKFRNAQL